MLVLGSVNYRPWQHWWQSGVRGICWVQRTHPMQKGCRQQAPPPSEMWHWPNLICGKLRIRLTARCSIPLGVQFPLGAGADASCSAQTSRLGRRGSWGTRNPMRCSSLFAPGRISDYSGLYMVVSDSEDSNLAKLHHHLQCGRSAFKYFRRIARPSPKALPRTAAALLRSSQRGRPSSSTASTASV